MDSKIVEALLSKNEIILAIGKMYFAIYQVDLVNDTFETITGTKNVYDMTGHCGVAYAKAIEVCRLIVAPEFLDEMLEFVKYETLPDRMADTDTIEMEYQTKGGEWHEARFIAIKRDENNRLTKVLLTTRVVSKEKQLELEEDQRRLKIINEELQNRINLDETRMNTVAEAIHGGFKISKNDRFFTFIMVSEQLAELLGYDSVDEFMEASGGSMAGAVNLEDAAREIPQALKDINDGKMYTMHYRMRCKDGSWMNVEDRGRLIHQPGSDEYWSFIVDQDELIQKSEALEAANRANAALEIAQKELELARDEAERANRYKSEFLFNMSHDIRTPMNAIMGYSKMIKAGLDDPVLLGYQDKMEKASEFLMSLINNVLDMARIESGKMVADYNYGLAGDIVTEIVGVYEEAAKAKNLDFEFYIDVEHQHILRDEIKIKQVYSNLISNAIKYTPPGGSVKISTIEKPCDRDGYILIESIFEDTGIGMSQLYLPHIFEAFTREGNTTSSRVAGTGLGMPIVKKLVELMGGTISVESELGKGTKFTVVLPHRIAEDEYSRVKESHIDTQECIRNLAGKHILLAEDNDLNAEIAISILEEMGFVVELAKDGVICVDKIEQHPAGTYDLILMDIQMPNMNGYKATAIIRRLQDKEKASIPIVAMTANAFEEDRRNAFKYGMNGHVAKPVDVNILMKTIAEVLE